MTLSNSIEIRKARTEDLAQKVQAEIMRRQAALLRVPEVCYQVLSDLTQGLSAEQNSFVNILSAIYVDGEWQSVTQLSHGRLVAEVGGLLDRLSTSYQESVSSQRDMFEDDGVSNFAKHKVAKVFAAIQVNDFYLRTFFSLRDDIEAASLGRDNCAVALEADEAALVLAEFDSSQAHLKALTQQMMILNEPAFRDIIRPYITGSFNRDDLIAEANDGFYRACIKFNPQAGASFYSFLKRWVVARVVAFIDRESSILSIGSNSGAVFRKIRNARKELGGEGRVVRLSDIAKRVGVSVDAVETCEASFGSWGGANDEYKILTLESCHKTPEEALDIRGDQDLVANLLRSLDAREAQVVAGRYGIGCSPKTLDELGDTYGVSCEAIRQIQRKAERKMAKYAEGLI